MSDVEAGGGTVFTQVGTTLFPSKVREKVFPVSRRYKGRTITFWGGLETSKKIHAQ